MEEKEVNLLTKNDVINQIEKKEKLKEEPKNIDENEILILNKDKNEKKNLSDLLLSLNEDLNKKEYPSIIDDSNDFYSSDDITKRELKDGLSNFTIYFIYYIIAPFFAITNLIGIFEIKSIIDALFKVLKNSNIYFFKKYFLSKEITLNFKEDYNFYNILLTQSINISPDFNLIMIMDFLGCILLKSYGFRISSIIFLIINTISLFLIYFIDFNDYDEENLYSFNKIIYIFICFLLLFIGVGSSALLSQQILIDSYLKLKYYLNSKNSKKIYNNSNIFQELNNKNTDNNIIQINDAIQNEARISHRNSLIKSNNPEYFKNILENSEKKKFDYFFMVCINTFIAYFTKYILSLFIYKKKMNYDDIEIQKFNKSIIDNITMYDNIYNHDKSLFFPYIIIIYIASILLSIILYWFFTCIFKENKKDNKKDNKNYTVLNIFGFTIYKQKKINKKSICCECLKLFCKSYKNCCDEVVFDIKDIPDAKSLCCCKYDSVDYEKDSEFFCYCYKKKRQCKWFNEYITSEAQKKLVPKLIGYFFLQLSSIYSIKIFDINNIKKNNYSNDYNELVIMFIILISSFAFYLFITLFFGRHFNNKKNEDNNKTKVKKISNEIMNGMEGVIYFNGIYSFIIIELYWHTKYNILFEDNYYLYITILMNKFYYFTFIYYNLSISEDKKGLDLMSGATLISIYLLIWNLFRDILINYVYVHFLAGIQFAFSVLISLLFLSFLIIWCYLVFFYINVYKELEININKFYIFCNFCCFSFCMYSKDNHDCCGYIFHQNGDCIWKCCCMSCICCKNCIDFSIYDDDNLIDQKEKNNFELTEEKKEINENEEKYEENEEILDYEEYQKLKSGIIKNMFNIQE